MEAVIKLEHDKVKYPGLTKCTLMIGDFAPSYFVENNAEHFPGEIVAGALEYAATLVRRGQLPAGDVRALQLKYDI